MIELKRHDVLKIQDRKYKWTHFSLVADVNNSDDRFCRYILHGCQGFNDDFMDFDHSMEIIAVWRYDERTNTFVNIYDKDVIERIRNAVPIKANPTNCYTEPCKVVEPNNEEKPCEPNAPADVPYDKYIVLEHENAELRNIIVELNKKLYGKDNQIH